MVVNSRFIDVKYVTLLLHNITAGQSCIQRSHFRKYILLGSTGTHAYRFNNGGSAFLRSDQLCTGQPCLWIKSVDKFKRKEWGGLYFRQPQTLVRFLFNNPNQTDVRPQ